MSRVVHTGTALVALLAVIATLGERAHAQTPPGRGGVRPQTGQQQYAVTVTPDGGWEPDRSPNSGPYTATFTASNTGTSPQTFAFECWGTGGIDCASVSPTSRRLTSNQSQTLTVTYSVGSVGGELRVSASATSYDEGFREVATPPNLTLVLPAATAGGADTVHTRQPLIRATYTSTDATIDTTSLIVRWNNETVTNLTRRNTDLVEWEVDSTRALTPGGAKDLYINICNTHGGCAEHTWSILLDNSGAPLLSFTGMPLEAFGRQFGAPFGPGLSVTGAEVETGFAIPAYYSMGAARSAGLVYSTRQSYPRILVNADLELTWPTGTPDQIRAVLIVGGTRLDSLVVASPTCSAASGRRCRITLQGDLSGSNYVHATRFWAIIEVRVSSGGTTHATTDSIEAVVVDRRRSPYGSGWFVGGVLRLDSAGTDMLLVGPTGSASLYRGANGRYLAPPGDRSVLVFTGASWELRFRDHSKVVFDSAGRQTHAVDAHGNALTIRYDSATGVVTSIADPLNASIVFAYSGGKLASFTDPGSRVSRVTINGSNQLTADSLASDPARWAVTSYIYTTYAIDSTIALASVSDALGQATTVSYDARRRPSQTTLPAVLPETGSTPQSPTIGYRAQVLRGLDTLLSADSIFTRLTDPLGNWTSSALSRWGAPTRTWDALGTTARSAYSPEGLPLWSEGKVADSSRIYLTYDLLGNPTRSFRLRTAADTVRLDSLVYDTNGWVIKHLNAWGQRDTVVYNYYGDVLTRIRFTGGASGDTTTYTYNSNGIVASVRAPNQTGSTQYAYDANWNLGQEQNAAGVTLATHYRDAFGRDTAVTRRLTVRLGETADSVQWRRSRTWYSPLNEVTKIRLERTDNCLAPCTPPSWPTDADTARWQQVEHFYDRLGRDTARANTFGKRARVAYDALGRVRQRWPYGDSTAVVDSTRYDLAGNLRYLFTRRGVQIEHRYDSRNRDTLTVVPGLGNYRQVFGGPGDQLTRLELANYVDSIGGVSPAVSWTYSQAGLLLTDTAQGNRVGTALADRFGRDSILTDLRGTTAVRYDAIRGVPDTVITPFADTVGYAIDSWGRLVGPGVRSGAGNPRFAVQPAWDQVGKLTDLATTQPDTVKLGEWAPDTEMPDLDLKQDWNEQHGTGGTVVVTRDTVSHDAWRRVTAVQYLRNGALLAAETFRFARDGGILLVAESRTYDVATSRMTARAGGTYSYDRAGNLVSWTPSGGSTWTYTYDPLDRLIAVRQGATLMARYAYDVLGRRIVKRVYSGGGAAYLRMIYGGDQVIAEADSGGTIALAYVWAAGTDNLLAVHRYGATGHWYVVQDALGSVRGLTAQSGTWAASWRYRIYGLALDSAGTPPLPLRYRWAGREYDTETGFYYLRARYYDPASQRFIQEDPIGFAGGDNLYAYTEGDPTKARDPSGLEQDYTYNSNPNPGTPSCFYQEGCPDLAEEYGGGGGGHAAGGIDFDALDAQSHFFDNYYGFKAGTFFEVQTRYAHLSAIAPGIRKGVFVAAGTLLGLSGCTGWCDDDHLHFEARYVLRGDGTGSGDSYPFDPMIGFNNDLFTYTPLSYMYVVHPFGERRDYEVHPGWDLHAVSGTPVFAVADGVVVRAGGSTSYGNVVYINSKYGY